MVSLGNKTDERVRLNRVVFFVSIAFLVAFSVWSMIDTTGAEAVINAALGWVSKSFGWLYFLAVVVYLVFVIVIAFTKFGRLKLGRPDEQPAFNILSWASMLFAAGIGIDILFFSISEPVAHLLSPPRGEGQTVEAAQKAMQLTYLHWGLSGWGIYTLLGMSLAFFSYRLREQLTFRSALYPIFGERIHGAIGDVVDIAAVLGTTFGIATSLGIGVAQLNAGLDRQFGVPETTGVQAVLVALIIVFATISAVTGVARGIRRLSEFNMILAALLLLFVLITGNTLFLLNALVMNTGDYLTNFVALSTNTYAFDPPRDWLNGWTIFFWAWWIAWGPFVGLFLARISRGRTIRQFVAGTLLLPMGFILFWMGFMGNTAMGLVLDGATEFGKEAAANPASSIYLFLEKLPWTVVTSAAVTILAVVFFVTSGDSGSLVLSNITSRMPNVDDDAPPWMRILWAGIIGLLTLALLVAGGLWALQSAVVIMGLPFCIVLFLTMFGLVKALRTEYARETAS